jgi:hypothetical protein
MLMNSGSVLGYFLQAVPITCLVGILFVIIRARYLRRKKRAVVFSEEIIRL